MNGLLTRTTAPRAIRFFYLCFQRGVLDACESGDTFEVNEYWRRKSEDWTFGTLTHPEDTDWKAFRSQLYWWAREAGMKNLAENYFFRIRNKNYTWCILPYCMRFYLMGISEWLEYPYPGRKELFKKGSKGHWNPNSAVKTFTRMDIISYLHTFEFEYRKSPEEAHEVSEAAMSSFIQAIYDLSRKYVTGIEKEEDI